LVTFPAASVIFTSASDYGLSRTEYGGMFVPQAVTAIVSALLGAGLTRRLGAKRIFLLGLVANLASMALLVLSRFVIGEHALAYGVLLVATACLGVGFGFTVPTVNTFAAAFFPQKVDKAVLTLNALLGTGTALAPVFVALFVGLGIWWGLPVLVGALILGLLLFSGRLPLRPDADADNVGAVAGRAPMRRRLETTPDSRRGGTAWTWIDPGCGRCAPSCRSARPDDDAIRAARGRTGPESTSA
jgi:MFS family permease